MRLLKQRQVERALGPIIIDLPSDRLTSEDREILLHPYVGGVILFSRNFECAKQISALAKQIHGLRSPALLVCVDHEGGRVQRFREGFTHIPAMRKLGVAYDQNAKQALQDAKDLGWLLAAELRACNIDFSFTPVLDLDYGLSTVIGDRAFHEKPAVVAEIASAFQEGLKSAGMISVGKHFPGHGYVVADSHTELPVDDRTLEDILSTDFYPFKVLVRAGMNAVMPAHVVYKQVDNLPAGFSAFWIQEILRKQLGFSGLVISDDLSMAGAHSIGPVAYRAEAAFEAGCDAVLVCNDRAAAIDVLDQLPKKALNLKKESLGRLMPPFPFLESLAQLQEEEAWQLAVSVAEKIHALELPTEASKIQIAEYRSQIELM